MSLIYVFDLGNVLLNFDYTPFFEKISDYNKLTTGWEEAVFAEYHHSGIARGGSFADFHAGVSRALGMTMPLADFARAWSDIFTRNAPMIELARHAPRPRFLLSNTDATHMAWIREQFPEVLPLFDGAALSHEVGATKPDPRIYQHIEALSGAPAERHVFIDDVPEFVEGARARGWQAIHFTGAEACTQALAQLQVLFA